MKLREPQRFLANLSKFRELQRTSEPWRTSSNLSRHHPTLLGKSAKLSEALLTNLTEPCRTYRDTRLPWKTWDGLGEPETTVRPRDRTVGNREELQKTSEYLREPCRNSENRKKPSRAAENLGEPKRTAAHLSGTLANLSESVRRSKSLSES